MQPLIPLKEEDREAAYRIEETPPAGRGWGAVVVLLALVAVLTLAIWWLTSQGATEQSPTEPAPADAPAYPGG